MNFTPSEFLAVVNQTLDYAYPSVMITGEVASFKVNQGKWVFFDIKDKEASVNCFMTLFQLRTPLEDGMKVIVKGTPKVTRWGKFSFTVSAVQPVGEGSLKKSFEILKKKLDGEGLFDYGKKRLLPKYLERVGVISSTQAAGYADFIKIINERWCGLSVQVAHTQVQGMDAPDQIIRALNYFNERGEVQVIAILRGGGSADDLACFNDEALVRAIAASKIPVITGIGHEVDETLCDLAADVRASTPSNAAEKLTPDKSVIYDWLETRMGLVGDVIINRFSNVIKKEKEKIEQAATIIKIQIVDYRKQISGRIKTLAALNPERVLRRGYAVIRGDIIQNNVVKITTYDKEIKAEIKEIYEREKDASQEN